MHKDEYTNEPLSPSHIHSAILDECKYVNDNVWVGVEVQEALADPEAKVVGCRWVTCNKGDVSDQGVRARHVAQEPSICQDASCYAATPPLEAGRLLFSTWATEQFRGNAKQKLSVADVRKA